MSPHQPVLDAAPGACRNGKCGKCLTCTAKAGGDFPAAVKRQRQAYDDNADRHLWTDGGAA